MNGFHDLDEESKCKLKVSSKIDSRHPVIITDFLNGRINPENSKSVVFESFKSDYDSNTINRTAGRILMANAGRLNYQGVVERNSEAPINYFVGVRNKTTGKMKLYSSVIFNMKPDLQPIIQSKKTPVKIEKSYKEIREDLALSFGSKAQKRAINAKLKYSTQDSLQDTSTLEELHLDSSLTSEALTPASASRIDYFPQPNGEALSADQVFDIHDIISHIEFTELEVQVEMINALSETGFEQKKKGFCSYIARHLIGDISMLGTEKLKYLLYYSYLVEFQNINYLDLKKKNPLPTIPDPFKQCILDNFTVVSKSLSTHEARNLPLNMKDKLLAHIIILALFIDDFCVNLNNVSADLKKISMAKLVTICKAIGCHVNNDKTSDDSVKIAILKLPLFVMPKKFGRKKTT